MANSTASQNTEKAEGIVIFGAGSAIAQATARLWAKDGARLVLVDRSQERLDVVANDLKTRGAQAVESFAADLGDMQRHQSLIKQIRESMDPDVYLFAYGTLSDQKRGQTDFSYAHDELHLNFVSVASLLTEVVSETSLSAAENDLGNRSDAAGVPHRAPGGNPKPSDGGAAAAGPLHSNHFSPRAEQPVTLAVISSVAGDRGRGSNYIYGTAKGALTIWLQGLRNRLTREGSPIHVLTIKPGFVDTPMTKDFKKGLLWVQPEVVARGIVRAIEKKKDVAYLPWFWRYIMLVIKLIPERIFKKLGL